MHPNDCPKLINYLAMFLKVTIILILSIYRADALQPPNQCKYQLVESMPENLTYKQALPFELLKTHQVFLDLINNANETIYLASFYAMLTPTSSDHLNHPSATPGRLVLEALESAARDRKVKVVIVLGFVHAGFTNQDDLRRFEEAGIEVKHLDVTKLLGAGIQHSKFLIADDESLYLGSANLDWRAFTQVKEMGISFNKCEKLAQDLSKIFKTYSMLADRSNLLGNLPDYLSTEFTPNSSLTLNMDNSPTSVFLSTSPQEFNSLSDQRVDDIDAILNMISRANKFIYISVMKFRAFNLYSSTYWPTIENALRAAVLERKVTVKLLIAKFDKQQEEELGFYRSLEALQFANYRLGRMEVKFFKIPNDDPFHASIPHSRIKHDKYLVTDNGAYIGTSNWEQDYFRNTCGVGISIIPHKVEHYRHGIVADLARIFNRDYFSEYTQSV